MSSGLRVIPRTQNPTQGTLQLWWLVDQLKKKKINQKKFAAKLGVPPGVLAGRSGTFPADKIQECLDLLENWTNEPKHVPTGGLKTPDHPWIGPAFGARKSTP